MKCHLAFTLTSYRDEKTEHIYGSPQKSNWRAQRRAEPLNSGNSEEYFIFDPQTYNVVAKIGKRGEYRFA